MNKTNILKSLAILALIAGTTVFVALQGKSHPKKYMISITYSESPDKAYADKIPLEKTKFKELRKSGKIIDGYVTPDHSKGWMILKCDTQADAEKLVSQLPLFKSMKVEYTELAPFSRYWHL